MFNPSSDLTAIQNILIEDSIILSLLDLSDDNLDSRVADYIANNPNITVEDAEKIIKAQCIIKRSQWNDLLTSEKRICIYFIPSRKTRNEHFNSEGIQIDCHVPAFEDYKAYEVHERIYSLLNEKKINNRYTYFYGQLGELPTMSGFFCAGSRYIFNRKI